MYEGKHISILKPICELKAYRIINKTKTTPINTIAQAPSVPPTITGKLSDEDEESMEFFETSRKTV